MLVKKNQQIFNPGLNQSGTKPNLVLVAKNLATNFGIFFVIYVMFSNYVQYQSYYDVMA